MLSACFYHAPQPPVRYLDIVSLGSKSVASAAFEVSGSKPPTRAFSNTPPYLVKQGGVLPPVRELSSVRGPPTCGMSGERQGVMLQVGDALSGVLHDIHIPAGCRCVCLLLSRLCAFVLAAYAGMPTHS